MRPPLSPLLVLAPCWLLGLWLAAWLEPSLSVARGLSLAAFAGALATTAWALSPARLGPQHARGALAACAALALTAALSLGPKPRRAPPLPPRGLARIEVRVEDARVDAEGRGHARVRVLRGKRLEDKAPVPRGIWLWAGPAELPEGSRVRLLAKLSPRLPFRNPSPHPRLPDVHATSGRAFVAGPAAVELLDAGPLERALIAARSHVRHALERTLPSRAAGVARALVLGEGSAIADSELADVRDAGLSHLLAVSGLHVALLAGLCAGLVRRGLLWSPLARRADVGRLAALVGIALSLGYAQFAGGASSAWRAAWTAALAFGLSALGRRPSALPVAALAVIGLSAVAPERALTPGFLLSVVATAAVLTTPRPPRGDALRWLRAGLSLSARTALATGPIVLWCFGRVAWVGVLANLALVPLGTLLLTPLSALHALIASVFDVRGPSAWALSRVSDAFFAACKSFAELGGREPWPVPDQAQGLTMVLAVVALLWARRARTRLCVLLSAVLLLGALEWRLRTVERPRGSLRVSFLDVGQGDSALIDLPDGRLMLIDAGGNPDGGPDPGRAVLLPLLSARRRFQIDIAVLSHPHPDHYGGLAALLPSLPVRQLWDSGQAHDEAMLSPTSAECDALLEQARKRGTRVLGPSALCGRPERAGGARIELLAPCPGYDSGYGANDNSLVVRLEYGRHAFLFAGDAERHAEQRLLERGAALRADVLKVAHHGSRTSSTLAFLRAVQPRLAVISSGAGNRFGHPHAEVRQRLDESATQVVELARRGGLIVHSDGRQLHAESWDGFRRSWR